ncbi:MAG: hypothetical protein ABFS28_15285 [Bacteroidota bacterium]
MKTHTNTMRRFLMVTVALFITSALLFADGETAEVYLTGSTNTPAGEFVVQTTNDVFHFQGREYEVYRVYYDDPNLNMRIAVNNEGKCNSFVAYNGQYSFFYNCNKYGFGVRKVMFANPWAKDQFSSDAYYHQTILQDQKKIEKKDAISMIASYVPMLYRWEI